MNRCLIVTPLCALFCLGCARPHEESARRNNGSTSVAVGLRNAPVPVSNGLALLSPDNTTVQFFATRGGRESRKLQGRFTSFRGQVAIASDGTLADVTIEMESASLTAADSDETERLRGDGYFAAKRCPTVQFVSKTIVDEDGEATVTGDLTLLGVTKEITFPATVILDDAGVVLKAQLTIDRDEFGMPAEEGVERLVGCYLLVGEPTPSAVEANARDGLAKRP